MNDNQLYTLLFSLLNDLTLFCDYKRSYQPTQQGRPNKTTVYVHKIDEKQYGFPSRKSVWNKKSEIMDYFYEQTFETTFKFSITHKVDLKDINIFTHSDILKKHSFFIQSDYFIEELYKRGVQILRIGQIKILYVENDQGLFEESPTFDLTLIHKDGYETFAPCIKLPIKQRIERV